MTKPKCILLSYEIYINLPLLRFPFSISLNNYKGFLYKTKCLLEFFGGLFSFAENHATSLTPLTSKAEKEQEFLDEVILATDSMEISVIPHWVLIGIDDSIRIRSSGTGRRPFSGNPMSIGKYTYRSVHPIGKSYRDWM